MTKKPTRSLTASLLQYGAVLGAICLVSGACLSCMFAIARDRIEENEQKAFAETLEKVMGEAEEVRPLVADAAGVPLQEKIYVGTIPRGMRYAARGATQGYQSEIVVLAAVDGLKRGQYVGEAPVIYRVAVVSSAETPGLGDNINKAPVDVTLWAAIGRAVAGGNDEDKDKAAPVPIFLEQFTGKKLSDLVVDKACQGGIEPLTGATISSRAVTRAVRQAVERIVEVANP
ncbi:MAG: FMN-binding protein [Candidatus Brocadiia bacterium]|nr:FMN-binding protein [Candidatus Brocadiia bacterium]